MSAACGVTIHGYTENSRKTLDGTYFNGTYFTAYIFVFGRQNSACYNNQ